MSKAFNPNLAGMRKEEPKGIEPETWSIRCGEKLFHYYPRYEDGKPTIGIHGTDYYDNSYVTLPEEWGHAHVVALLRANGADIPEASDE